VVGKAYPILSGREGHRHPECSGAWQDLWEQNKWGQKSPTSLAGRVSTKGKTEALAWIDTFQVWAQHGGGGHGSRLSQVDRLCTSATEEQSLGTEEMSSIPLLSRPQNPETHTHPAGGRGSGCFSRVE
jgi:hypothetical protein